MRNSFFIFISFLLFVSCWNNKENTQQESEETNDSIIQIENLGFSSTHFNKKKKIFDSEIPSYSINIDVKYAKGESSAVQLINQQLVTFLFGNSILPFEGSMQHFADSLCNDYEREIREFYDPENEYQDTYAYEYNQTGKVSDDSPEGIIVYTNRIETYTGGAHGGVLENYINFHKDSGAIITCHELFGNKEDDVKKLIKKQIIKDNGCKTEAELIEKKSIFSLGDVFISDYNFLIQKDGILFCFNPYDIAPWSEGFVFVKLTYKQMEGLLSPNFAYITE